MQNRLKELREKLEKTACKIRGLEENYTKAGAKNVRKMLDEICNEKVQFKKDMIEFEKTLNKK